jgi:hypothetical protein
VASLIPVASPIPAALPIPVASPIPVALLIPAARATLVEKRLTEEIDGCQSRYTRSRYIICPPS